MDRIEFDAVVESEGRIIRVPDEYIEQLAKKKSVHVTASADTPERESVKLMKEHPLFAPGATPFTREEIYERRS